LRLRNCRWCSQHSIAAEYLVELFGVSAEFAPYSYRGGGTTDTETAKWVEGAEEKVQRG
jgi:hypothetical protein